MAKAKKKKGQHHVPATYLSAWCDPKKEPKEDPFVWRFTPSGELIGRKAPENLFKETDFYTIPMPDGSRNLQLEDGLNELETNYTIIRGKIQKHQELDLRDIVQLQAFMVAMYFRTKAQRDHQRGQWSKVFEMVDSMEKQFADGRPGPPISVPQHAVPVSSMEIAEMKDRPIQQLLPIQMEIALPLFLSMDIAICDVDEPQVLLTCDNPCIWFDPEAITRPPAFRQGVSLVDKNVEVSMPLSPHQIVLLNRKGVSGYCKAKQRAIEEWNRRAVAFADEEVIANTNQKEDVWFSKLPLREDAWENTSRGKEALARKAAWEEQIRGKPGVK